MTEHGQACAACAQEAGTESKLRETWRAAMPAPTRDLWPQIATRLEDQSARSKQSAQAARPPQWALVSAFCLAVAAVCGLSLGPKEFSPPSHTPAIVAPALTAPGSGSPAWTELSDVSRVDPTVDDPAGTSMDNVWVQINTSGKAGAK